MSKQYDAIIIGTGQSGPALAARLAKEGMKVAIIERKLFGGTCVNTGCIPTKTLVSSARAAHVARRGDEFGFTHDGSVTVDMKRVKERKDGVAACMGVTGPVKQAYLHQVIPSDHRATVISFNSMMGNGGSVASQVGLGYVSRIHSIALGFVVGGIAAGAVVPVLAVLRRLGEPADSIIGTAGHTGGCTAAQGLSSRNYS